MADRRLLALFLGICMCQAAACTRAGSAGAPALPKPPDAVWDVRLAVAEEQVWERVLRLTGELAPAEEATISAKVAGRLESLAVDVGSKVPRNECVARIEGRDFEMRVAQAEASVQAARALLGLEAAASADAIDVEQTALVREARAQLDQARRELVRATTLAASGAATQSMQDQAKTDASAAESRWHLARETVASRRATLLLREAEAALAGQQFADTRILAPFDGVIAERLVGTGDYLVVGAPIARLLRSDPVRLRLIVPEQHSSSVRAGQELRAHFDSGAATQVAHVARLAPALGTGDRSLSIEADIPNPEGSLRPGSFVRAELVLDPAARTLAIPPAALVRFAGIDKVFVAENLVAVERRVKVGRIDPTRVEVLDGLKAGDSIVLDPGRLQGGARLRVGEKD